MKNKILLTTTLTISDLGTIPTAAFAALNLAGEVVDSAVIFLTFAAPLNLALNHLEDIRIYDGLMVTLYIVLRNFTFIDFRLLGQEIDRIRFLQQGIALVFFIGEDALNCRLAPFSLTSGAKNSIRCKSICDAVVGISHKEHLVDAPYGDCFFLPDRLYLSARPGIIKEREASSPPRISHQCERFRSTGRLL